MWRQQVEWLVALPLRAVLLEVRLDLDILEPLLEEAEQGAGGNLRVCDDRPRDEGLVGKGEGGVGQARLLQVPVDEEVDFVGAD